MRFKLGVVLATVGLLAACGGGGGGKTVAKAEFIQKATAACKKANDKVDAASADLDTTDRDAVIKFVKDEVVPDLRQEISDLRAIGYPEGDKDKLEKIYKDADSLIDQAETKPEQVVDDQSFGDSVNKAFDDYGLNDECGSGTT
jgi:hypothetical protein